MRDANATGSPRRGKFVFRIIDSARAGKVELFLPGGGGGAVKIRGFSEKFHEVTGGHEGRKMRGGNRECGYREIWLSYSLLVRGVCAG